MRYKSSGEVRRCINLLSEDGVRSSTSGKQLSELTRPDAVSTVPTMVRGDWVLFHPVYSPEELKAVQVCQINTVLTIKDHCLMLVF